SFASVLSNHAKDYLQRYSRLHGMSLAQVQSAVESQLERLFVNNLLPLGAVDLPIEVHPPGDLLWECGFCGRVHLHMSGGVCTRPGCVGELIERDALDTETSDYYAWLSSHAPQRLAVAELTGQTSPPEEARRRQRRFRGAL